MNISALLVVLTTTILNYNVNVIKDADIKEQGGSTYGTSCSYIGELSIFSYYSPYYISSNVDVGGHAFISFTNYKKGAVSFGKMTLKNDEKVTIGNYGNLSFHKGSIYNLDSYKVNVLNEMNGRVSLSIGINLDQLIKLNLFINNHDTWLPTYNCSSFVEEAWNLVSNDKVFTHENFNYLIYKPEILVNSIKSYPNYQTNKYIKNNSNVGYYDNLSFVNI